MQATAVPPNATVERRGFSLNGALVAIVEIVLILGALALILFAALGPLSSPGSTTGSAPIGLMPALGLLLVALLILRGFRLMRRDLLVVGVRALLPATSREGDEADEAERGAHGFSPARQFARG